jgi:hypothetical protein
MKHKIATILKVSSKLKEYGKDMNMAPHLLMPT